MSKVLEKKVRGTVDLTRNTSLSEGSITVEWVSSSMVRSAPISFSGSAMGLLN